MAARPESDGSRSGLTPKRTQGTEPQAWLTQAGLLTAIPFVLLVGPTLGYYLGNALDRRWSHAPWGVGAGLVVGLAASARVTIQLIRQAQALGQNERTGSTQHPPR